MVQTTGTFMKSFKQFLIEQDEANNKTVVDQKKIAEFYNQLLPKLQHVEKTFEAVLRASLPKRISKWKGPGEYQKAHNVNPVVLTDIKTLGSVISKVKRGKKVEQIGDLVRGAVLFPDHASVEEFVKSFVRKNQGIIAKHEIKAHGGDLDYGYYGSQHLDLMIDGLRVELQVMTQKLWKMKHAAHVIYTKTREEGATESDKIQSRNIFKQGNKPKYVREEDIPDDFESLLEFMQEEDRWTLFLD